MAEIKAVFPSNNILVAGVLMQEGKVNPNNKLSIIRNGKEVFFGKVNSLKHYKDDVKELVSGQEGGWLAGLKDDIRAPNCHTVGQLLESSKRGRQPPPRSDADLPLRAGRRCI